MKDRTVSRMAPTPNGELHWGNLYNFSLTWAMVRKNQGKLWLRFDDIDQDRCEEKYATDTRKLLTFLGLDWDDEFSGQFNHLPEYKNYLERIPHYVCSCSRQDIHSRTGDYHYDGHCRDLGLQYQKNMTAIRFRSPKGSQNDFVIWRKENIPAYHLTSVSDDERLGINLIVRGEDLLESTEVQKELSASMKNDPLTKVDFIHHPLIHGLHGEKLSKSRGDGELVTLMKEGKNPEEIWKTFGKLIGKEIRSREDLFELVAK
ncbi:MAG: glutamate--tRNA ligase family protein [Bacteriovoracaceae bacterium]